MQQVKLWMNSQELDRMVDKIMSRLAEIDVSKFSPCAGLTRENCPEYILNRLKQVMEEYGHKPAADLNNMHLAFTFGLPLNDTVFMLSGCLYPDYSAPATAICNMEYNGGASDSYAVDFYHHI